MPASTHGSEVSRRTFATGAARPKRTAEPMASRTAEGVTDVLCPGRRPGPATIVGPALLDRWTGDAPVGAEDAAVAGFGLEQRLAARAFVEVLAGVRRHGFGPRGAARRAGQGRLKDDRHPQDTHETVRRISSAQQYPLPVRGNRRRVSGRRKPAYYRRARKPCCPVAPDPPMHS